VGDPPLGERVAQRGDDRLLADQRREILRAPLAGEDLVGHGVVRQRQGPVKGSGRSAALGGGTLSLLPSGPDEVRNRPMHRTRALRPSLALAGMVTIPPRRCKAARVG